ncbi:AMP-binding protein [Demequina sp. B12]|uniref:AMP-binding protein n=1 Tax=Demequina sp. B12 TaxID=2992757 RepID=UPI00237ADCAF|nr:AMP-binding protein [Demequina sp. B12]MDE0573135.1 AMP-binding protein [Demequina sp. B12]
MTNPQPGVPAFEVRDHDPVAGADRPWFAFYPPGVPHAIDVPEESSLGEMVAHAAQRYGDKTAFSNLGGSLSFTEVDAYATKVAAYFTQTLGLRKGDRVVLQMPNLLQYPVALFGALRAGLIVVNANPLYTADELSKVVEDAQPRAIVVMANFADKLERVLVDHPIDHVIITEAGDLLPQPKRTIINLAAKHLKKMVPAYSIPQALPYRALLTGDAESFAPPTITPGDVAFLQYTGGTTGGTKAAVLTHSNLLCNQEQFIGQIRAVLDEGEASVIAALPLYHVFALTVNCIGFFRYGGHNVLITNPRDIPGFIKTIDASKPHVLVLVSTLAGALMENPAFAKVDLSNIRISVAGGMALRSAVGKRWREMTDSDIIEGYGLTEASPVVSVNPTHLPPRIGTIGVPLPSTDVKVLDDDGKEVPLGQPGELAVRGPQVMAGYWNKADETAAVITDDGWLLTGDVATIDDEGYLRIVDRKKEIIVVSGFNVYPGDIEDAAMLHPGVVEAGAIPVADEHAGEVPKLFVVRRDDSLTEADLKAFLKERLTGYKRPRHIEFIDELPKTNVGKVLRRGLRELEESRKA